MRLQMLKLFQKLEDIYLPFRPKKRTRAETIVSEKGLKPLADLLR